MTDELRLAGAPGDLEGMRTFLAERFGMRLTAAELKALATVTPAMLTAPAERGRESKGRR
ncbi:MAG: hypothetical protein ABI634_14110 [Acidobacteriota bacterium]